MALKLLKKVHHKNFTKNNEIMHHSDHGVQYYSYIYTDILKQHNIHISVGEIGNCYGNMIAESLNGILKNELELGRRFVSKQVARKTVEQFINILKRKWFSDKYIKIGLQRIEKSVQSALSVPSVY